MANPAEWFTSTAQSQCRRLLQSPLQLSIILDIKFMNTCTMFGFALEMFLKLQKSITRFSLPTFRPGYLAVFLITIRIYYIKVYNILPYTYRPGLRTNVIEVTAANRNEVICDSRLLIDIII